MNADEKAITKPDDFILTKREYFAAMALEGLLPGPDLHITNYIDEDCPKKYAEVAVKMADALIEALNKGNV